MKASAEEYAKRAETYLEQAAGRDDTTPQEVEHRASVMAQLAIAAAIKELHEAVTDLRTVVQGK